MDKELEELRKLCIAMSRAKSFTRNALLKIASIRVNFWLSKKDISELRKLDNQILDWNLIGNPSYSTAQAHLKMVQILSRNPWIAEKLESEEITRLDEARALCNGWDLDLYRDMRDEKIFIQAVNKLRRQGRTTEEIIKLIK